MRKRTLIAGAHANNEFAHLGIPEALPHIRTQRWIQCFSRSEKSPKGPVENQAWQIAECKAIPPEPTQKTDTVDSSRVTSYSQVMDIPGRRRYS
jgi:hypothetical protein